MSREPYKWDTAPPFPSVAPCQAVPGKRNRTEFSSVRLWNSGEIAGSSHIVCEFIKKNKTTQWIQQDQNPEVLKWYWLDVIKIDKYVTTPL